MEHKLYRSGTDRVIAGVCGGIGEYFEVDPVLVRLAFAVLAVMGGGMVLLYILLILVIPKDPRQIDTAVNHEEKIKEFAHKAGERIQVAAEEIGHKVESMKASKEDRREKRRYIFGLVLVVLGFVFLFDTLMPFDWYGRKMFWPIFLILLGLYLVLRKGEDTKSEEKRVHEHPHAAHPGHGEGQGKEGAAKE